VSLDVTLRYAVGSFALDVAFRTPDGITALFGPSGSGKTLTLRLIAGLLRPHAGRIVLGERLLFDGHTGADIATRHRRIGYVFQQYALFPHLTVAGNVAYALDGARHARAARVEELLRLVGLADYGTRLPRELSGGEQQRVALARALILAPKLLLADEPTGNLDTHTGGEIHELFFELNRERGMTMLIVTHNPDLAGRLPRRVHMVDGRIEPEAPPQP
jgi:ABC-type sulfate/molybdate transport systems ATPase subunit